MLQLCIFVDHAFLPISWACEKPTAASHSSTKAEVMSLNTGFRMEGLPALVLWESVIDVLEPPASRARSDPSRQFDSKTSQITQEAIDHVPPNGQESSNRKGDYQRQDPAHASCFTDASWNSDWLSERVNLDFSD